MEAFIMKKNIFSSKRRSFLLAGASALLLPTTAQAVARDYGILGQTAPELDVSKWIDANGKASHFKLADHKNKFVFMEFWQSWCPGCHKHGFPGIKKISDAFGGSEHFTAVAIQTTFEGFGINTADKMREIQQQYDLNILMGHDAGSEGMIPKTMRDYRSGGTPWAVLISPEGKVIYNDFSVSPKSVIRYIKTEIAKL